MTTQTHTNNEIRRAIAIMLQDNENKVHADTIAAVHKATEYAELCELHWEVYHAINGDSDSDTNTNANTNANTNTVDGQTHFRIRDAAALAVCIRYVESQGERVVRVRPVNAYFILSATGDIDVSNKTDLSDCTTGVDQSRSYWQEIETVPLASLEFFGIVEPETMETRNTVQNGAEILRRKKDHTGRWVVLCDWRNGHDNYVVWYTDNHGHAFAGAYCQTIERATEIFEARVND